MSGTLGLVKHETAKRHAHVAQLHTRRISNLAKLQDAALTFRTEALCATIIAVSTTRSTDLLVFRAGSDATLAVKDMTSLLEPLRYVCDDIATTRSEASTLTVQHARMAYSALYCMRLFGQTIRSCQREPTRISAGSGCFYGCFEAFVGKHFPSACLYGLLQSKPQFEFGREGLGL